MLGQAKVGEYNATALHGQLVKCPETTQLASFNPNHMSAQNQMTFIACNMFIFKFLNMSTIKNIKAILYCWIVIIMSPNLKQKQGPG